MDKILYVTHAIDTEGPLFEPITATFERLNQIFNLSFSPSVEMLCKLQKKQIDLNGIESAVAKVLSNNLLNYNDNWYKIDKMLEQITSPAYRNKYLDDYDNGWIFNWFCLDHVDFIDNPRRRTIGYHQIFDHYRSYLSTDTAFTDSLQFHYHPHSFLKSAHHCATHWWANSGSLYQILSRRVLERGWFPSCNRPGFHVTRPDSHWFLEQYVPFDFASQAISSVKEDEQQKDLSDHRFGDWDRAPINWQPYHPAFDDYQAIGKCNRWITRCLNVGTRFRLLQQADVDQAFNESNKGLPTILAFTNHDFRDMRPDIDYVYTLLLRAKEKYPDVSFKYSTARNAFRQCLEYTDNDYITFALEMKCYDNYNKLEIRSSLPTFGIQPYFCFKTVTQDFCHDNLDIINPYNHWSYTFDFHTFPLVAIESIGLAANTRTGLTTVHNYYPSTGNQKNYFI